MKKKSMKNPGKKFTPHRFNKKILFTFAVLALSLLGLGTITVISQKVSFTTNMAAPIDCVSYSSAECESHLGCKNTPCSSFSYNTCPTDTSNNQCIRATVDCPQDKAGCEAKMAFGCKPVYTRGSCVGIGKNNVYCSAITDTLKCAAAFFRYGCKWSGPIKPVYSSCSGSMPVCSGSSYCKYNSPICTPGEVKCDTTQGFYPYYTKTCNSNGLGYNASVKCGPGTSCFEADGTVYHPTTGCYIK